MEPSAEDIRRFREGSPEAVELLVRAYSDSLVRFAYSLVRDSAAAEDIAEEAFATLLIKRKSLTGTQFKAYLYRVTRNKCIDELRKRKRTLPLRDDTPIAAEPLLERREREKTVYDCMQKLPEHYRECLYLVYYEGFSPSACADVLKKSRKQVYNLLARAKDTLKQLLIKEGFSDEDI